MALEAGQTLLHYHLVEKLGEGGMGVVWKAEDRRLGRKVALKVLRGEVAGDHDRMARFEREARLLASLNHENISALHGIEEQARSLILVMEYVDGETLADRLKRGPLPLEEALEVSIQIARGLEAAHDSGIIHRDLKTANVMIRPDGRVKILDFGLAKALAPDPPIGDPSSSPTISVSATAGGVILGTAAYMSPEQARGMPLDARTDIWSFGCVLYESLTGEPAFTGETLTDVLAAVLTHSPDLDTIPGDLPPGLSRVLSRCLEKDPRRRWHHIADVRLELEQTGSGSMPSAAAESVGAASHRWARRAWLPWTLAALFLAAAATLAVRRQMAPGGGGGDLPYIRFEVSLPEGQELALEHSPALAVSPDGRHVVYVARWNGKSQLFVRSMDRSDPVPLPGTEGGYNPFFSPDSLWVGFAAQDSLKKVPLTGGFPQVLTTARFIRGATWLQDGSIVFANEGGSRLTLLPPGGGEPKDLTPEENPQGMLRWPHALPGGRWVLASAMGGGSSYDVNIPIVAIPLVGNDRREIMPAGTCPRFVEGGLIVFAQFQRLLAAPFDPETLQTTAPPFPTGFEIAVDAMTGRAHFDVNRSGTIAFVPPPARGRESSLVPVVGGNPTEPVLVVNGFLNGPVVSPDGRRLAVTYWGEENERKILLYDLERGVSSQLALNQTGTTPVWTRDGKSLAIKGYDEPVSGIYLKVVDDPSPPQMLTDWKGWEAPMAMTPDGRDLLFVRYSRKTQLDIWAVPLDLSSAPRPMLAGQFNQGDPSVSPDGRWLAYASNESGRSEVYLKRFPPSDERWLVSGEGGAEPLWSGDGKTLYWRNAAAILAMELGRGESPHLGTPRKVFEGNFGMGFLSGRHYEVCSDGTLFVVLQDPPPPSRSFEVVLGAARAWGDRVE